MTSLQLADRYGRVATELRVSLTDRCNLRCSYCMPVDGLPWLAKPTLLTDDEVLRLITIAVTHHGVRDVRFTGGEPLLRPHLEDIITATAALGVAVSLTTNGVGLAERAVRLRAAGLKRINVSLDTLRPDRFVAIAHRERLDDVVAGLAAAHEAGLHPVKVNAVLLRDINDDEAVDLLSYCLAHDYQLRFIEQMPLDPMHSWDREQMVTGAEILEQLEGNGELTPEPRTDGAPARPGSSTAAPPRRCDRVDHPAVLLVVQPHPADRRWAGTQLLVRDGGVRLAHRYARRCNRRRACTAVADRHVGQGRWARRGSGRLQAARTRDVRDRRVTVDSLPHLDATGQARMVDVAAKEITQRSATATGLLRTSSEVIELLRGDGVPKGDALAVARIAAIAGTKRTADLIPLCHPLRLDGVDVGLDVINDGVAITVTCRATDRTGVEMEALTGVAVAGLALHDMVKAVDPAAVLTDVELIAKTGGRSGDWTRE